MLIILISTYTLIDFVKGFHTVMHHSLCQLVGMTALLSSICTDKHTANNMQSTVSTTLSMFAFMTVCSMHGVSACALL